MLSYVRELGQVLAPMNSHISGRSEYKYCVYGKDMKVDGQRQHES
jgi:hypothetical protein